MQKNGLHDFSLFEDKNVKKIIKFYALIQIIIWIKVLIFITLFGHGVVFTEKLAPNENRVLIEFYYFFTKQMQWTLIDQIDFWFHQVIHFLIALSVFLFTKATKEIDFKKLIVIFLIAAIMHNLFYWFFGVMPNLQEILFDFATDILWLFVFYFIFKFLINKFNFLDKLKIPFLD